MKLLFVVLLAALAGCAQLPTRVPLNVLEVISLNGDIDGDTVLAMRKTVDRINADHSVKAVLLEVNSPGGEVYASAQLYEELARLHVPVLGYCEEVCASGALYALMAPSIKEIDVGAQTIIGSVGVLRVVHRRALDDGVEIFKSGEFKVAGAVSPAIPGEEQYLQSTIDQAASIFYDVVAKSRGGKITAAHWVEIKQARVFDGRYGVEIGLADKVLTREQAVAAAKALVPGPLSTRDETKHQS